MVEVRRAVAGDLDALLPLVRGYREFYEQVHDPSRERELMASHVSDDTSAIYIAWRDDAAVGFVQIFGYTSTVLLVPTLVLEDLFVLPEARGEGIAAALLERSLEHARSVGAGGMFLETAHDNRAAQRVYERCGWVREGHFLKYNAPLP